MSHLRRKPFGPVVQNAVVIATGVFGWSVEAHIDDATHEIVLAARSAYLMTQTARSAYEHHIPSVAALRYSITFRTLR